MDPHVDSAGGGVSKSQRVGVCEFIKMSEGEFVRA